MGDETVQLATYASKLTYEDIPVAVLESAKALLIDTVAAIVCGHDAPWSGIVVGRASPGVGRGPCQILGKDIGLVDAETAALTNGTLAHALELDSLRMPGAGVHPGAVLIPSALAAAQEAARDGRALLTAIVAGCEVLFRVGRATKHSSEVAGFHAPGLTGPFGAAATSGHLYGLDGGQMANALGIAGSLCGGLLEFAASGFGGMVKRLHLGRAAQNGIVAAKWAAAGFEAPDTILEGKFGFLNAYCRAKDVPALTAGLGEDYETLRICLKRYACHITAHTPVRAIEVLQAEHHFSAADVAHVTVEGTPRMAENNANRDPTDPSMAQYSIPFCVAVALCRDPTLPQNFDERALHDDEIISLRRLVDVVARGTGGHSDWTTATRIDLKDGRSFYRQQEDFPGTPSSPIGIDGLRRKFAALTMRVDAERSRRCFERLIDIERQTDFGWLADLAPRDDGAHASTSKLHS